uniref:Uncharacterized protein n=1 Tax=Candidatus Kentrum sp. SD TaxID=2126332 RepID=A0A450YXF6_9GAMM|nr:MAG: hypothetical protein BECKSD772F_GA0070984_10685 [Candidatus Kentron sp. SD]VFK46214.1 MAG: hypothetical protein BECKSD772E_GA0070983_10694 [Candidatus Kentron sp. SD]
MAPSPLECAKLGIYSAMRKLGIYSAMRKLGIYSAMREQGLHKTELARRLDWHLPQVDRLLDPGHASQLARIQRAAAVLGKWVELRVF